MLIVLPWWPVFWEHNYFVLSYPSLRPFLTNNFVRGVPVWATLIALIGAALPSLRAARMEVAVALRAV